MDKSEFTINPRNGKLKGLPILEKETETDEGDSGEGGGSGAEGMVWQDGLTANLLPEERLALLDKIVRGMITEGHLAFGPKALKELLSKKEKIPLYNVEHFLNPQKGGGGSVSRHPLLREGSGLRAQVSPEWQKNENESKNQNKEELKLKNSLQLKQKLNLQAKPKQTYVIKETPKFTPRPPGF